MPPSQHKHVTLTTENCFRYTKQCHHLNTNTLHIHSLQRTALDTPSNATICTQTRYTFHSLQRTALDTPSNATICTQTRYTFHSLQRTALDTPSNATISTQTRYTHYRELH